MATAINEILTKDDNISLYEYLPQSEFQICHCDLSCFNIAIKKGLKFLFIIVQYWLQTTRRKFFLTETTAVDQSK